MNQALWIAKTGLDAQQTRLSVVANNLANVSTTGFKKGRAVFEDLIYQTIRQPGAQATQEQQLPSGLMLGMGVRTVATEKIFSQGGLISTDKDLDIAIQGRGFFQIMMPNGEIGYTRDGGFQKSPTGQVVMSNGYPLVPPITLAKDESITIGPKGDVTITGPGGPKSANIELANFVNPAGLQPVGENLFLETVASGPVETANPGDNGLGTLLQGFLEASNVSMAEELVQMIETQRAYEVNSKSVSAADQMMQYVNNNLAR